MALFGLVPPFALRAHRRGVTRGRPLFLHPNTYAQKDRALFYAAAAFSTRVLQDGCAGGRTALCKDHVDVARDLCLTLKSPTRLSTGTSQTPQRRRRANPAGIGCGGQPRSTRRAVRGQSRGRGWLRRGGQCARCDMCLQRIRQCRSPRSIGSPCARPPPAARR